MKLVKKVSVDLLKTLKAKKLKFDHWRDKESTRDAVRITILNFLWEDDTGLPAESYTPAEVNVKVEDVFTHVHRAYPVVPSPYYAVA